MSITKEQIDWLTGIFQAKYGLILGVARYYAPASDLIDDIVQQTYIDFIEYASKNSGNLYRDLGPLLCHIAKRKAQKSWRDRQKMPSRDIVLDELLACDDSDVSHWKEEIDRKLHALSLCLDKLPKSNRDIIEQHYVHRVSMKEIGRCHAKSTAAIHQFFCRIRIKLRECIEKTIKAVMNPEDR